MLKNLSVTENRGPGIICLKSDKIENLLSPKEKGAETMYICLIFNKPICQRERSC